MYKIKKKLTTMYHFVVQCVSNTIVMNFVLNFKFEFNSIIYIQNTIQSMEAIFRPISLSMCILYVMFFEIAITTQ